MLIVFCCGVPYCMEDEVPDCRRKRFNLCCSATLCSLSLRFTDLHEESKSKVNCNIVQALRLCTGLRPMGGVEV
jgi:hypothetical protein